jgi:colanic acid biosynthesis glycosyl transferase WcaI
MTSTKNPPTQIIFINRFFHPDRSATSQILSDLAFALAKGGFAVTVITSQRKGRTNALLPATERIGGVAILRITTAGARSSNLFGRAMEYLKFYAVATWLLFSKVRPGDILVAKTDPPLISVLAAVVAHLRHAKLVNWLQDLYPEVADKLGVPFLRGPPSWVLQRARDSALRSARMNVAISNRMAALIRHVAPSQIEIIPNWVDDGEIRPLSPANNKFRTKIAKQGEFIVGYSGTLGRAHEFETLLGAARLLAHNEDIVFVFIGGGHYISTLESKVEAAGLRSHFRFLPVQPLEELRFSLSAPDVHWVSLRSELEGLIVPSKFYGILAAGRPTIAIMARDGEISSLIEHHQCGIVIEPGDSPDLARQILRLKNDPDTCAMMGQRARQLLECEFTRDRAIKRWAELLHDL